MAVLYLIEALQEACCQSTGTSSDHIVSDHSLGVGSLWAAGLDTRRVGAWLRRRKDIPSFWRAGVLETNCRT